MPHRGTVAPVVAAAMAVLVVALFAAPASAELPVWATRVTVTPAPPPLPYFGTETDTLTQVADDGTVVWHTPQNDGSDTNELLDIYKWSGGTRTRVSPASGNGDARAPSIGVNGRIAFLTNSTNLASGASNWAFRGFPGEPPLLLAYTAANGAAPLTLPTVGATGTFEGVRRPLLSADGLTVVFDSINGTWTNPAAPMATTLTESVAVTRSTLAGTTYTRVSSNSANQYYELRNPYRAYSARPSADGSRVAFLSNYNTMDPTYTLPNNSNVDRVFVRSVDGGDPMLVSVNPATGAVAESIISSVAISGNGKVVAFVAASAQLLPAAANSYAQVFVLDMTTAASPRLELVSQTRVGVAGNDNSLAAVGLSNDGRFVLFASLATNLVTTSTVTSGTVHLYLRDRQLRYNLLITRNDTNQPLNADLACGMDTTIQRNPSYYIYQQGCTLSQGVTNAAAAISPSGQYAVFFSRATNFDPVHNNADYIESGYLVSLQKLCNDSCDATAECSDIKSGCQCKGDRAAQPGNLPEWGDPCTGTRPPHCGDGILDSGEGEQCDDNNVESGDGCNSVCLPETPGWSCATDTAAFPATLCSAVCGDGRVVGTEECDTVQPALACTARCTVRRGWACPSPLVNCTTTCGDGIVAGDEQCESTDTKHCQNCTLTNPDEPCFGTAYSYCGSPSLTSLTGGASSLAAAMLLVVAAALVAALAV